MTKFGVVFRNEEYPLNYEFNPKYAEGDLPDFGIIGKVPSAIAGGLDQVIVAENGAIISMTRQRFNEKKARLR